MAHAPRGIPVPAGYSFAATAAGFRKQGRADLALVVSDRPAAAAGLFTTNLFKAAPVLRCMELLHQRSTARAVLINSGQANACTGQEGMADCVATQRMVADACGLAPEDILPASTGVIGPRFDLEKWRAAMPSLAESLGTAEPGDMAEAIMTTDTFPKLVWRELPGSGGAPVRVLGFAKGAGMICPNMATMLGCVLTDAEVDADDWRALVADCVARTFNRVTVDGDTSTNDTVIGLANGASGRRFEGSGLDDLKALVFEVCMNLAYMIVRDAEGGTKVARIAVTGARDDADAELAARAVGHSPLVKTALFGADPNWGRVVAAVGRSGADFDPDALTLHFGDVLVFEKGRPAPGDMDALLKPIMEDPNVDILVGLGRGPGEYVLMTSDLTRDYVSINADYRS